MTLIVLPWLSSKGYLPRTKYCRHLVVIPFRAVEGSAPRNAGIRSPSPNVVERHSRKFFSPLHLVANPVNILILNIHKSPQWLLCQPFESAMCLVCLSATRPSVTCIYMQLATCSFCEVKKLTRNFDTILEHYLTPLHLALRSSAVSSLPYKIALTPFPSGTGHMITSLRANEIDIAIGLTEGWVAGLTGKTQPQNPAEGGYKVIGHWVDNPLRWAIVTGRNRDNINGVPDLKDQRVGVSRLGRYEPLHSLACGWPSNRVVRLLADYTAHLAAPILCPSFSPSNKAGSQTL